MATTSTTICHLALAEVPHASITGHDEDSQAAGECARAYGPALGELLEACRWTFATRRAALAEASTPRAEVWAHAYVRPQNLAVLHRIVAGGAGGASDDFGRREASLPYEVDEGRIYADAARAVVEYTRDDPPESGMPPLCVRALALDIASRVVVPLTGDAARKAQLLALHEHVRARAMAADLNRQPVVLDPVPEALRARG